MKKIKINFVDFWMNFNPYNNYFINLLKKDYEVEISQNPEFLFCSVFGEEHKKYYCTKIWYTGENRRPNFDVYDYSIGFDWIENGNKYMRFPLYHLYVSDLEKGLRKHRFDIDEIKMHDKFCNFIYSNGTYADPRRAKFFYELSKYKRVDSAGKYLNNIGLPLGVGIDDKLAFQSKYKFSIAFENAFYPGYSTEKILHAFAAKTIPIYWGNPEIYKDFNTKAFINCHDYVNFDEVIKKVIEIDNNYDLFVEMMMQPIVNDIDNYIKRNQDRMLEYLKSIIER